MTGVNQCLGHAMPICLRGLDKCVSVSCWLKAPSWSLQASALGNSSFVKSRSAVSTARLRPSCFSFKVTACNWYHYFLCKQPSDLMKLLRNFSAAFFLTLPPNWAGGLPQIHNHTPLEKGHPHLLQKLQGLGAIVRGQCFVACSSRSQRAKPCASSKLQNSSCASVLLHVCQS